MMLTRMPTQSFQLRKAQTPYLITLIRDGYAAAYAAPACLDMILAPLPLVNALPVKGSSQVGDRAAIFQLSVVSCQWPVVPQLTTDNCGSRRFLGEGGI